MIQKLSNIHFSSVLTFFCLLLTSTVVKAEETIYVITKEDVKVAKEKELDIFTSIFGEDLALQVSRRNRLDPKFAKVGIKVIIPEDDYQPMPIKYERFNALHKAILVRLDIQFLGLYEYGKLRASYPISSAKAPRVTTEGEFTIDRKDPTKRSPTYPKPTGGCSMPWASHLRASHGIWLHAGDLVGHSASPGCIRMLKNDARLTYSWLEIGALIKIVKK